MNVESKAIWGCAGLAAGNAALLAALVASPFKEPWAQLGAGACAMFLHGWCAWEIGSTLRSLARRAQAEALGSRLELAREARLLAKAMGQGGRKPGRPR